MRSSFPHVDPLAVPTHSLIHRCRRPGGSDRLRPLGTRPPRPRVPRAVTSPAVTVESRLFDPGTSQSQSSDPSASPSKGRSTSLDATTRRSRRTICHAHWTCKAYSPRKISAPFLLIAVCFSPRANISMLRLAQISPLDFDIGERRMSWGSRQEVGDLPSRLPFERRGSHRLQESRQGPTGQQITAPTSKIFGHHVAMPFGCRIFGRLPRARLSRASHALTPDPSKPVLVKYEISDLEWTHL